MVPRRRDQDQQRENGQRRLEAMWLDGDPSSGATGEGAPFETPVVPRERDHDEQRESCQRRLDAMWLDGDPSSGATGEGAPFVTPVVSREVKEQPSDAQAHEAKAPSRRLGQILSSSDVTVAPGLHSLGRDRRQTLKGNDFVPGVQ